MTVSALTLVTRLNTQLSGILTALDIDIIGRETSKQIARIRQLAADARLDVRDWEMAENRAEMQRYAAEATGRLDALRAGILKVSEHGIFTPIDVMDLSSQIDSIAMELG